MISFFLPRAALKTSEGRAARQFVDLRSRSLSRATSLLKLESAHGLE